jgi:hypothetical protein
MSFGDGRVAFAASWELYRALADAIGEQHVLLAFDGEKVELMSPGRRHEVLKVLLLAAGRRVVPRGPAAEAPGLTDGTPQRGRPSVFVVGEASGMRLL